MTITFAGHNSHEPLEIGSHTTIRKADPKYSEGAEIVLLDEATSAWSYGFIETIIYDLNLGLVRGLGMIEGERSHLADGELLALALKSYYPDLTEESPLIAIDFRVYLSELI